jgi:dUTPase
MTEFEYNVENDNPTKIQLLNLNVSNLLVRYDKYMYLKIFVDDTNILKNKYINNALNHNNKILNPNNLYLDAGFDILNPTKKVFYDSQMSSVHKFDHNIICSAQMITDTNKTYNTGYYMHPRSSLSKTKLRLANATGIIDSGYRGHLIGMFDLVNLYENEEYFVNRDDRLLQICAPGLVPIVVEIVNTIEELGCETERGAGGFGSTGR